MIVEKPYIQRCVLKNFNEIKRFVKYDMDIAVANNIIIDLDKSIIYNLQDVDNFDVIINETEYPKRYRLITSGVYKDANETLVNLLQKNNYDAIINACGTHKCEQMTFDYVIDSFKLHEKKIISLPILEFTDITIRNLLFEVKNCEGKN